jgi:TolB-like protein/DNA-binding winged helix-turn-helix (wHTH) protein/Flp pilus assembly protein TadD
LRPQASKILVMLARRPGQLITREEIKDQIWGTHTFVDFENGLNFSIRQIRAALNDDADTPRYIETLPRRGYRFIAPVDADRQPEHEQTESKRRSGPLKKARWGGIALAVGIVIAIAGTLAIIDPGGWRSRLVGTAPVRSIAVLPLANLSGDPAQEYLVDGVTEELITQLAQIGALKVISRSSAMHYKGTSETLPQIGRELNVDAVVEGSVQRSGNQIRITAQLIQTATDRHLWAQAYTRDSSDVLAMEQEVARAIADEIKVKLTPQEEARLSRVHQVVPEAYEDYLKGRYYWNQRVCAKMKKGMQYFESARDKDPQWALPYVGIADTNILMPLYCPIPAGPLIPQARAAVRRALELDDGLAEAHASLGLLYRYEWNWDATAREFKRAIELKPSYAPAHHWYGLYLSSQGRQEEAIAELDRALELDPLSPILSGAKALVLFNAHRYADVVDLCQKAADFDPTWPWFHFWLGAAQVEMGQFDRGLRELQTASRLEQEHPLMRAALGYAYARAGKSGEAVRILGELNQLSKGSYVDPFYVGLVYAGLGQDEEALTYLRKSSDELNAQYLFYLNTLPWFAGLNSDPHFQDLLYRIGLPTMKSSNGSH